MMEDFGIRDVTERAKAPRESYSVCAERPAPAMWEQGRVLLSEGFTSYPEGSGSERLEVSDMGFILIGDERIDVRMPHNIATQAQLDAVGFMLRALEIETTGAEVDLKKQIDFLYYKIEAEGLDCIYSSYFTACGRFLDLPRKAEIMAVINRMRKIGFVKKA